MIERKEEIGIILFATPKVIIRKRNSIPYTYYHIANIYRNKEKYRVTMNCSIDTGSITYSVSGVNKPTGFEPFCKKWAERFKIWAGMINWGYDWEGFTFTDKIETEISCYCDRFQVLTCYEKDNQLTTLRNLAISNCCFEQDGQWVTAPKIHRTYAPQYVKMLAVKKSGWWKTIQIK